VDRLTTALKILALIISLVGVCCLYQFWQPTNLAGIWRVVERLLESAVGNRWVQASVAVAVLTTLGARWLERMPPPPRSTQDVHELELAQTTEGPTQSERRERDSARQAASEPVPRLRRSLRGDPKIPAFVDELLSTAVQAGASDLHIQPLESETRVAWRVRGELTDIATAPREHHERIVRRLKILAQLTTYKTDMPQDGRFTLATSGDNVDVRMSVLPTRHGEKVVLRLARSGQGLIDLSRLGMPDTLQLELEDLLSERQGLIVLTGPTGCGKTTTLYAALEQIHKSRGATTSISTIEDPIEIDLPFLSQTQVDHAVGLTFAQSLRAVLRQDPNVLMVGEIRDQETAHIAVEAGLTGHLILTTLHADSGVGVFNRLIDMDVEPFLVSSSVLAVVSQRLARRLCEACRRPATGDPQEVMRMVQHGISQTAAESLSFYEAPGCEACEQTGLGGRTAIFELLRVTPAVRELVTQRVETPRLAEAAVSEGMTPLLRAAVQIGRAHV